LNAASGGLFAYSGGMTRAREKRAFGRFLGKWGYRLLLWPVGIGAGLLLLGAFAPMPSTLMVLRRVSGEPVQRTWVPLDRISPHLSRAVIASEDQLFCVHWGVDFEVLREIAADPEGPARGGSTISMQTVKNVYLWHGRSYIRKAIEIPLALTADLAWGKRRMMEVYLNVAEWGDGIFGAEAASRYYFRKSAASLTPSEAARLAAALPNPEKRGSSGPTVHSRRVLRRMGGVEPSIGCVQ
jgi:monofunctional glycosyltransferase